MPIPKDKRKFALWLYPETLDKIKQLYAEDDCRSEKSDDVRSGNKGYANVGFRVVRTDTPQSK